MTDTIITYKMVNVVEINILNEKLILRDKGTYDDQRKLSSIKYKKNALSLTNIMLVSQIKNSNKTSTIVYFLLVLTYGPGARHDKSSS